MNLEPYSLTEKQQRALICFQFEAVLLRGYIIQICAPIEQIMDCITSMLKSDYQMDNSFGFKQRVDIFKKCLVEYDNKYMEENAWLSKKITTLATERNKLAHWVLDETPEGIDFYIETKSIRFMRYKAAEDQFSFDYTAIKNLEKEAFTIMMGLSNIYDQLR